MEFDRFFEMPSRYTFERPKVRKWVLKHCHGRVLNAFGGETRLDKYYPGEIIHNDLDPNIDADYHFDAMELDKHFPENSFDTVILDPPFTMEQVTRSHYGAMVKDISRVRDAVKTIIKPNGTIISLGYNSTGMGKIRGCKKTHLLIVNGGSSHNDVIVLVERLVQPTLQYVIAMEGES